MKKLTIAFASVLAVSVVLSGCGAASKSGTLKVGVRNNLVNLGFYNSTTEQHYGLEIDLANALAEDLGYASAELVDVTPDDREEKLDSGAVDCIVAAYTITDERKETYDFSPAYYQAYTRVMVENSSMIESVDDLKGKTIGVRNGTIADTVVSERLGSETAATFVSMETYDELAQALEVGTVDAISMDGCIARAYLDDGKTLLDEKLKEEDYGVATLKGSKLSSKIADSIQKMLDDGTITEMVDKWD